jgi:hypothetical protein
MMASSQSTALLYQSPTFHPPAPMMTKKKTDKEKKNCYGTGVAFIKVIGGVDVASR